MIRNENEYHEAAKRLREERERLDGLQQRLHSERRSAAEINRVLDPLHSFHLQLAEEVESYERLRRGQFSELQNLHGLGRLLVGLRIARDMSQRELAEKLGVHESQVSRDERNEYHGLTVQRAARILDALGARLTSHVEIDATISD
ncbi:MAG: helix-turn-helix transcriptional regulator [Pirellulaceae bacterium]